MGRKRGNQTEKTSRAKSTILEKFYCPKNPVCSIYSSPYAQYQDYGNQSSFHCHRLPFPEYSLNIIVYNFHTGFLKKKHT